MNLAITIITTRPILNQLFYNNNNNGNGSNSHRKKPQIVITTNPNQININNLSQLYVSCNHSPHRFPSSFVASDVDSDKLRLAVHHSAVVVSVFANRELVGFGRAISDLALTASLFDVMVIPSLRRLGIGRMIVQRILRMLTTRGVYDISALCSDEERLFFAACGFGDDLLGSTTMTYRETVPSDCDSDQLITRAGRMMLLSPPLRLPFLS